MKLSSIFKIFRKSNKLTIDALANGIYVDADTKMFHAMFQILVDFVELEQPFDFPFDTKKVRNKDINNMRFRLLNMQNEEKQTGVDLCSKKYSEILFLYEWYINREYIFDFDKHFEKVGKTLNLDSDNLFEDNGKKKLISIDEFNEIKEEHKLRCNSMLYRLLDIREFLWT